MTAALRARDTARAVARWLVARPPTTLLVCGWIAFVLGAYPGYMSFDSVMQLAQVRAGEFNDAYSPMMTGLWWLVEYVAAGPFPMLLLQSGLFLVGLAAVLRTALSPRAASAVAGLVLLFPPVFAPMAVIWPDSLMTGALLAGTAGLIDRRRGWRIVGGALLALACSCRPEVMLAILPLGILVTPKQPWWRRAGIALGITLAIVGTARLADWALTETATHAWQQRLMVTDVVGTLRRAKVASAREITRAVEGLPVADPSRVHEQVSASKSALDAWPLVHGDRRVFDPITTEEHAAALSAAWRRVIVDHPGGYVTHRWMLTRYLLGLGGRWSPIFDDFGDPSLLAGLSHRATTSDWQVGMRSVVRAFGETPLFRPWIYLLLAIAAVFLTRRWPVVRALVRAGLVYQTTLVVFAPAPEYRFSHWLVTATCIAFAVILAARRWPAAHSSSGENVPARELTPGERVRRYRPSPRVILIAGLSVFFVYSWPGYVGWDTRSHMLMARSGEYPDGHPPAVSLLFRIVELFVAGPMGVLVIQAVTLLVGLHLLLRHRLSPHAAALAASLIFLFPPISGVTALVVKDALMAGFLVVSFALLLHERPRWHRLALVFVLLASLMRWNALAATFAPMILLFRWSPRVAGWRRYGLAVVTWVGVTFLAMTANSLLATERTYVWHGSYGYQDIAGTLKYLDEIDDVTLGNLLTGTPLRVHERLHERFRAVYNPADSRQLHKGKDRLFDLPRNAGERAAVLEAWKKIVLRNPTAYFRYRWDNFRLLIKLDRPPTFTNVYVWFHVLAAPETVQELEHDAAPSRIQAFLREESIWISLTPLYFTFVYFAACFVMIPLCIRRRLETAILLSAIGYELAWFVLASTTDYRYSQWMILCSMIVAGMLTGQWIEQCLRRRTIGAGKPT